MKKTDQYVLLGVFIFIGIITLIVYLPKLFSKEEGALAIISQNGIEIEKIDLSLVDEPYEFTIESENAYNTIYVEKNKIKFIDSSCPDKVCIKTGSLAYSKDIAVCLPNKLFIEIESGKEAEVDSLLY